MVNRPSQPEIITVNSEELQSQIRDLLPSQNGFGSELQASNVITPIIDLTRSAEGSGLPSYLQTAIAFGSNTDFTVQGSTSVLFNSPGFYRIVGTSTVEASTPLLNNKFQMTDGLSTKDVWEHAVAASGSADGMASVNFDLVFWLRAGDSLSAISNSSQAIMSGSHRQVATGDGTLVQPSGYPL